MLRQFSALTGLICACLLLTCTQQETQRPSSGYWLARVPYKTVTYRMLLEASATPPKLINVSFKANEIRMDTIYFQGDSLHLKFGEFYTEFNGHYQRNKNQITGTWVTEDSVKIPVTFQRVQPDTVLGLHPRTAATYTYRPPAQQNDQWPVCSLADQNMNSRYTDSLMHAIIEERYRDIHSVLIARNNCLVLEEYFYTFKPNFRQNIQSVTKSFVSALTGIALGKREIKSVNETLCSYLPTYREFACNDQNQTITLHHLLSMSTGLAWDEATYDYMDPRNSAAIADEQPDPVPYLLQRPRSASPVFAYNSMNHSLMNAVLHHATSVENSVELPERLLKPLGIESYYLGEPVNGVLGDIELRPRDMMKLGLLYLNEGRWNDTQLVPADWVKQSTNPKILSIPGHPDLGYGYFWWTTDFHWKGKKLPSSFAWGYGGQYIIVVPDLRLVVAFTGSHWGTDPRNYMVEVMERFILSGCE